MNSKEIVKAGYNSIAAKYLATRTEDSADVKLLGELVQRLPSGVHFYSIGEREPILRRRIRTARGFNFSEWGADR